LKIPFSDHSFYRQLFDISKTMTSKEGLESWYLIDRYIELNIESMNKNDLMEMLDVFAEIKYFKFKFWYSVEKFVIKKLPIYTNNDIVRILYNFTTAGKGSNYIFVKIAEEIQIRGIRSFTGEEFKDIYYCYEYLDLPDVIDKVFLTILKQAKKEVFYKYFEEENVKLD